MALEALQAQATLCPEHQEIRPSFPLCSLLVEVAVEQLKALLGGAQLLEALAAVRVEGRQMFYTPEPQGTRQT